jgi:hypothetical protein
MSMILVTGMSGTGKSSALAELGRRGYRVVDTDDPGWREYREDVESSDELHRGEWLWVEDRITGLLDSDDGRPLFVSGCVRNQSKFYDRFDAVVLLSAPADVILDRVSRRTTNSYGKPAVERAMILDDLAMVEPLLRNGCTHELDASRPLADIVADPRTLRGTSRGRRQSLQSRLHLPPVVVRRPRARELLHRVEPHALRLVLNGFAVRPPHLGDAPAEIVEVLLRNVDTEGADRGLRCFVAHLRLLPRPIRGKLLPVEASLSTSRRRARGTPWSSPGSIGSVLDLSPR